MGQMGRTPACGANDQGSIPGGGAKKKDSLLLSSASEGTLNCRCIWSRALVARVSWHN